MKKTFVLLAGIIFMAIGARAQQAQTQPSAQQPQTQSPPSSGYLLITFYEDYVLGGKTMMIQTRADGTQQVREINWKSPYNFNRTVNHEDSLMQALKPFLDEGWVPTISNTTQSNGGSYVITRYIFKKEQ
jgi:hypothetical protein